MEDIGERLRENGWRQGVIVPAADVLEGLPDGSPATAADYVMVVSQSCDLVHHDLVKEPSAVFLVLKSISSMVPDVLHGRNPRLIHFSVPAGQSFEAWAWNQVVSLTVAELKELVRWDYDHLTHREAAHAEHPGI